MRIHSGLICTSIGGPVTTLTWKRDGQLLIINETTYQQSQWIVFTENATYETILHIPDDNIANYNAIYECLVFNSRGNDSSSITLEGKLTLYTMLKITDQHIVYSTSCADSPSKLICWGQWQSNMYQYCLLYTSPSPRDATLSRMPSSA